MNTEFEIVFREINREKLREQLKNLWAKCIKENGLMKRTVFANPMNPEKSYVRVRDEWDKITCTYKEISDGNLDIYSVKELELEIWDYNSMIQIFSKLWLRKKSTQETYRETWNIDEKVYFMLDEWPGLKPFIEIEWESEEIVKNYSEKLWFDYNTWLFGTVDEVYFQELWLSKEYINNLENITFEHPPRK